MCLTMTVADFRDHLGPILERRRAFQAWKVVQPIGNYGPPHWTSPTRAFEWNGARRYVARLPDPSVMPREAIRKGVQVTYHNLTKYGDGEQWDFHGGAIHAFRFRRDAEYGCANIYTRAARLLRVWVHPDDVVAANHVEVAARAVIVTPQDWRALRAGRLP